MWPNPLIEIFKWALDLVVRNLICETPQVRLTSNGKESEEKTKQQCGELFDLAAEALRLENIFENAALMLIVVATEC